jgi:hypothetical protein
MDLTTADRHLARWQSFAAIADDESVSEAQRGLIKLFQMERYEEPIMT